MNTPTQEEISDRLDKLADALISSAQKTDILTFLETCLMLARAAEAKRDDVVVVLAKGFYEAVGVLAPDPGETVQ